MVVLTSFTQPTDGIRLRQNNTTVYVNNNNVGKGTLYIAESCLSWISDSGDGFSIEYPHISLHAVSRDLLSFPQECLFLMLDTALGDEETYNGDEEEYGNENGSDEGTTEIRLIPDDRGMLEAMFLAMNACQALHPDPEDSFSDEDFYEGTDDEVPVEEADHRMAELRIENMDGRPHIGRVAWEEDMEEDIVAVGGMGEDMEKDNTLIYREGRVGGIFVDMKENRVRDRVVGILGGMEEGRVGDRVVGILGGMEEGRVGDRVVVGTSAGMEEDKVGDRVGDRVVVGTSAGMEEDRVGGRVVVVGISPGMGEDRMGDRVVLGISPGMGDDWVRGISPPDMEAGRVGGTCILGFGGVGSKGSASDTARGDRSFALGNIGHPGRTESLPSARSSHMDLEEDSNFSDAEN